MLGQHLGVGCIEILQVIGGQGAVARGERRAMQVAELFRVQLDGKAVVLRGAKHPFHLPGRKSNTFTERIHRIGQSVSGQRRQHFLAHELDVRVAATGILVRKGMGTQECGFHRHLERAEAARHSEHLALVLGGEAIARFDLDRGYTLGHQSAQPRQRLLVKVVFAGLPRRLHGGCDATAASGEFRVARAIEAHLELSRAIAAVDQMGVAIDQSGGDEPARAVEHGPARRLGTRRQRRSGAHPRDFAILDPHRTRLDQAVGSATRRHGRQLGIDPKGVPIGVHECSVSQG